VPDGQWLVDAHAFATRGTAWKCPLSIHESTPEVGPGGVAQPPDHGRLGSRGRLAIACPPRTDSGQLRMSLAR
jgi:hypothetical protein